ncbi:MAG: hypothetical protein ACAI43_20390 [Phycisphaerae bacterium]|nr:hypothetical protein [Tepidisphaeraceae bacterium]
MKHPVLGTLALLAILAGGLYAAWWYKGQPLEMGGTRATQGAGARSALQASMGLILPPSASDVYAYEEEAERTKLVFARFDIPAVDLPALLDQRRDAELTFPSAADLKADADVLGQMGAQRDARRAWWNVDGAEAASGTGAVRTPRNFRCAQKMGQRNSGVAKIRWRVQVCAGDLDAMTSRVFIAFSEEAVGKEGGE